MNLQRTNTVGSYATGKPQSNLLKLAVGMSMTIYSYNNLAIIEELPFKGRSNSPADEQSNHTCLVIIDPETGAKTTIFER